MRNVETKRFSDEFKFVISGRDDFDYARQFIREYHIQDTSTVLISPVMKVLDPKLAAQWLIREMPFARLNLQLHKYIWHDSDEKDNGLLLVPENKTD
jgi:7-carboxy-7-deazaguanine synthase